VLAPVRSTGYTFGTKLKLGAKTPPETRRLGYARVSTYGQTLDAQLEQLRAEGCARIFRERVTGARPDRRELLKLLKAITPGDVVTMRRAGRCAVTRAQDIARVRAAA
jgi:DNA invertase Pin-like site-specific DNA recombinase